MNGRVYGRIAEVFHEALETARIMRNPGDIERIENVILAASDIFEQSNIRFDRDRFLKACGFEVAP